MLERQASAARSASAASLPRPGARAMPCRTGRPPPATTISLQASTASVHSARPLRAAMACAGQGRSKWGRKALGLSGRCKAGLSAGDASGPALWHSHPGPGTPLRSCRYSHRHDAHRGGVLAGKHGVEVGVGASTQGAVGSVGCRQQDERRAMGT